ncbi:MAG: anti-sigma factor [Novosphingobium sp.]|nr:anti-sigma factor [Novosphingobium sp.]
MTVTREELAAYADGELDPERRVEVEATVKADPALAAEIERHRRLKDRLASHFAPILEQSVPDRLAAVVAESSGARVIDLAQARQRRTPSAALRRWGPWLAGPALAASLALALLWQAPGGAPSDRATGALAAALDTQLAGDAPIGAPRILLSFRDRAGAYCRAYRRGDEAGLACRDGGSWRIRRRLGAGADAPSEYRQAGSGEAAIFAAAQNMAAGPALTPAEEAAARARDWTR